MAEESEGQKTGVEASAGGAEAVAIASPPSGDRFSTLWRQFREHRIAQWSVGYIAVAYGIQHAVTLTSEAYDWPHVIVRVSMTALALGLPLAMVLAWYHGERASRGFSRAEFSILAVLLCIGAFLFYVFVRPEPAPTAPVAVAAKISSASVPAKATNAPVPIPSGPSVAVLPFLNLSGDPKEEFFSDGMTEEITSALANVKGLRVVARTSAFAFKGKNEDIRTIGQQLSATDVIEGSVRKEGNEVRITAQLIRTDTGDHLWTDSYDRELKDVFAVQEDIARAIAAALQVPLGLKQGENLVSNRNIDPQAYEDYLRGLALYRARDIQGAITVLEPTVKRDPSYAPAWALLALAYALEPTYVIDAAAPLNEQRAAVTTAYDNGFKAAQQAVQLDPRYALGHTALGWLYGRRGQWAEADSEFEKALALDPTDPDTIHLYSQALEGEGRLGQALKVRTTLRQLEPFVPVYNVYTASAMQLNGDIQGAVAILEPISPSGPVGAQRDTILALAYASTGKYQQAAATLLSISPNQPAYPDAAIKQAADILRKAPAKVSAPKPTTASEGGLGWVYAFVGAPERAVDALERQLAANDYASPQGTFPWYPALATVRKTESFKDFLRKDGLVDYWRAKGWPDLCHPETGDDFECN